ncbi:hypothetical protein BKI52_41490 [marine bacterium AO1-C]|nr:hypothetical protein BKI52_41490 [marine bacterium AO1-C]
MKNKKFSKFTALNSEQMRQAWGGKGFAPPKGRGGVTTCGSKNALEKHKPYSNCDDGSGGS